MKSILRVSSTAGLGADCSRVATCGGGGQQATIIVSLPATPNTPPCHPQVRCSRNAHPYLLVVGPDQAEDEATVHQGQQVAEEEGQAGIEALSQLRILGTQGLSAHNHTSDQTSVPTQGLALVKATSDFQEPRHYPRAWDLLYKPCLGTESTGRQRPGLPCARRLIQLVLDECQGIKSLWLIADAPLAAMIMVLLRGVVLP